MPAWAAHADQRWLGASIAVLALACLHAHDGLAQNRGVYPLGMSAINSGVMAAPGFTYSNLFLFYSRDELKGPDGELVDRGRHSVLMDMNGFLWTSKKQILGGATIAVSATLPIANNSLTSDTAGAISGGGGFADSYYQPLILGWQKSRVDFKVIYGFLAPTGRFEVGASDNVGSGYWTHVLASGQTFYLSSDRKTVVSAFQMYEFHGTQEGTDVKPGQTLNLDYSVTRVVGLRKDLLLQFGVIGYGQWQMTDHEGPTVTPEDAGKHYRVNALGMTGNLNFPERKVSLGLKYYNEFSNRSTTEGYSVQVTGSITF